MRSITIERKITYKGETKTLKKWSEITSMKLKTLQQRIYSRSYSWATPEKILMTPERQYEKRKNTTTENSS